LGGPPTSQELRYDLASLTKPLATASLLLLARRDGLSLDAPLGSLLPELAGTQVAVSATVVGTKSHFASSLD